MGDVITDILSDASVRDAGGIERVLFGHVLPGQYWTF